MTERESPFACDMTQIAAEQRDAHAQNIARLFTLVTEFRELPNGYAVRLPNTSDVFRLTAQFIELERLCCPFFDFNIHLEREGGPFWLSLTGREGVKPFILAEIGQHLPTQIGTKPASLKRSPVS